MATHEDILRAATDYILTTVHDKKLIIAGPGAGKTFIFTKLLENLASQKNNQLVLTFINTLKEDLDNNLSHLSHVYTLHGFCNYLLHNHEVLRKGITENFFYYPPLVKLIFADWRIIKGTPVPKFIQLMRTLTTHVALDFYFKQANFYDAISYDESVYRTYQEIGKLNPAPAYKLILIFHRKIS
jgi:superfamily I DNA/RNA helicase